jgi:hypothetical protein
MRTISTSTDQSADTLSKWKSPLLLTVCGFLLFELLSGFLLFFFAPFMKGTAAVISLHWLVGTLALFPYAFYQWRHYRAVTQYRSLFHYRLGLYTFFSFCVVTLSGIPLIFKLEQTALAYIIIDMIHVVSSFAFLILLSGHLMLVARVTLARLNKKVPAATGTFSLYGRWIMFLIAILILLLLSFLSFIN